MERKNLLSRAIISVSDKEGLEPLLNTLKKYHVELISSGGTARYIEDSGYPVIDVTNYTGYPEMPGGLVKTLHPKIYGGIMGDVNKPDQFRYMIKHGIKKINLVVVNFYPFEEVISERIVGIRRSADYIDIGGPALVRASAKAALLNGSVSTLIKSTQYPVFIRELNKNRGNISPDFNKRLALEAFKYTELYDRKIKEHFEYNLK
jgi:phosphoribosylaminoimidazolecarboxamide formyltransferase/IMP cyclohydrolase